MRSMPLRSMWPSSSCGIPAELVLHVFLGIRHVVRQRAAMQRISVGPDLLPDEREEPARAFQIAALHEGDPVVDAPHDGVSLVHEGTEYLRRRAWRNSDS